MSKPKMTLADVFAPFNTQAPKCPSHQFKRPNERIGAPCDTCGHPLGFDCHRKKEPTL